jgi:hypothetical protein
MKLFNRKDRKAYAKSAKAKRKYCYKIYPTSPSHTGGGGMRGRGCVTKV